MGIRLIGLFCLLVCCELSAGLAFKRSFRFGNTNLTRSYNNHNNNNNNTLRTSTESTRSLLASRKLFNEVDGDGVLKEALASNVSRTFGGEILAHDSQNGRVDVRGVGASMDRRTPAHPDTRHDTQADTSLSWMMHTLERKHMKNPGVHQRPRRAVRTNQSESGSVIEKLESLPEPSGQKQPTELPTGSPPHRPAFTLPEDSYEESTPLGPINTRPRAPGRPNPFYPVTGETYAAYAIILVSVIMFTAGIIGNIAIMCAVCHNYYMRSVSNSLLANLALWDFLITFFCLPLVIFHQLTKDWLLGEFSCKIIPYFEVKKKKP